MSFTMNAKIGVAALVAALFVAFGAFALQAPESAKAGALPPLRIYQCPAGVCSTTPLAAGATVNSGTPVRVVAVFGNNLNPLSVSVAATGAATTDTLVLVASGQQLATPYPATLYSTGLPNNNVDVTPLAQDDDSIAGNVYDLTASTLNAIGAVQTDDLSFELRMTVSCNTGSGSGSVTVTQAQSIGTFNDGVASLAFSFNCANTSDAGVISVKKVDQFGQLRSAAFAIQQQVFSGTWITIATMQAGSTSATNPCLSTAACTTNPASITAGLLPPGPGGTGVSLPNGTFRVIEITTPGSGASPTLCTLVEVHRSTVTGTVVALQPVSVTVPPVLAGDNDLVFVNSCAAPGAVSSTTSTVQVVLGGATGGLTNTTHIEINPAPGSDDDARVDIRVRDGNGVNIPNSHVTVIIDKGAIAMRTDTTGAAPSGYEVIEPAFPFIGTPTSGDTCDQFGYYQLFTTTSTTNGLFNGGYTRPYISTSPRVQDSFTNADGIVSACVYVSSDADASITPGKINGQVIVETPGGGLASPFLYSPYGAQNIVIPFSITVVGPPASVTVTAAPTSLQCGEKATITADVKDSVGQAVSDHTRIELVSNFGATIGGTGATLGFPGVGPVNPVSSSAAETFNGKATAFLLTSTEHVGPYEVVIATGGSTGGLLQAIPSTSVAGITQLVNTVGSFSTAPVSAQVTVTCSVPSVAAPAPVVQAPITAPRTGEGIRPPNTGDAGLASTSGGSSLALVIAGVVVAFAGAATLKFARR